MCFSVITKKERVGSKIKEKLFGEVKLQYGRLEAEIH